MLWSLLAKADGRLQAVPSWQSQGLVQGKGGFFFPKVSLENHLAGCIQAWRSSMGKGRSALFARARSTLELFSVC